MSQIEEKLSQPINDLVRHICSIISEEFNIDNENAIETVMNDLKIDISVNKKTNIKNSLISDNMTYEEIKKKSVINLKEFCKENNHRTNGDKELLCKRVWGILHKEHSLNEPPPSKRGRKSKKEKNNQFQHIVDESNCTTPINDNEELIELMDCLGMCKRISINGQKIIPFTDGNYYLEVSTNEVFEDSNYEITYIGKVINGFLDTSIESSHA